MPIRLHAAAAAGSSVVALMAAAVGLPALAAPTTHVVVIEAMKFSPETVEASVGDTIVWTNRDPFAHTATAQDRGFDSAQIASGQSWRLEVTGQGAFAYVCTLHPTMKGTLVVRRK